VDFFKEEESVGRFFRFHWVPQMDPKKSCDVPYMTDVYGILYIKKKKEEETLPAGRVSPSAVKCTFERLDSFFPSQGSMTETTCQESADSTSKKELFFFSLQTNEMFEDTTVPQTGLEGSMHKLQFADCAPEVEGPCEMYCNECFRMQYKLSDSTYHCKYCTGATYRVDENSTAERFSGFDDNGSPLNNDGYIGIEHRKGELCLLPRCETFKLGERVSAETRAVEEFEEVNHTPLPEPITDVEWKKVQWKRVNAKSDVTDKWVDYAVVKHIAPSDVPSVKSNYKSYDRIWYVPDPLNLGMNRQWRIDAADGASHEDLRESSWGGIKDHYRLGKTTSGIQQRLHINLVEAVKGDWEQFKKNRDSFLENCANKKARLHYEAFHGGMKLSVWFERHCKKRGLDMELVKKFCDYDPTKINNFLFAMGGGYHMWYKNPKYKAYKQSDELGHRTLNRVRQFIAMEKQPTTNPLGLV